MEKAVLIYDGDCAICRRAVRRVGRRAWAGELELLPLQAPDLATRYPGLPEDVCRRSVQLVLPDGRVLAGSEAIRETLVRLKGVRWLSHAFRIPGVKLLTRHLYGWIASNRHLLSQVLAREQP